MSETRYCLAAADTYLSLSLSLSLFLCTLRDASMRTTQRAYARSRMVAASYCARGDSRGMKARYDVGLFRHNVVAGRLRSAG